MTAKPFLPSDIRRPSIARAAAALVAASAARTTVAEMLAARWPGDKNLETLTRAASAPATDTTSAWASDLVGLNQPNIADVLGPSSAAATLFARGLQLQFNGTGRLLVQGLSASSDNGVWLAELGVFPVLQLDLSSQVILSPRKLVASVAFSREATLACSAPDLEKVVGNLLSTSLGLAADKAMLDATSADTTRPAGLRTGISASTANETASPPGEAMLEDLATLASAVAGVAGDSPLIFVAAPRQAASMRLRLRPSPYEILASGGLADGMVLCIASNCLVTAVDPVPRLQIAKNAVVNFDSDTPADIGVAGVLAGGSTRSAYQADLVVMRAVLQCSFGLRSSSGLAWLQDVVW
jgi:hypothetical protein